MRLAMLPGGALRIRVLRALAICLLAWLAPAIAFAQTPGDAAGGGRAQLEAGRLDLTQIEAALQRERLDDRRLDDLRKRLEPLARVVGELIGREQPKADEIKARIEKLGPAPDPAKGQTESPEVARDRAEQQRLFQEADETLRLARALSLRIEQAASAIADRRRGNFTREILAPGASILSPWLWLEATQALPSDLRALTFLGRQWLEAIAENLDWYEMVLIGLLLFAVLVGLPRLRLWVRSGQLSGTGEENGSPAPLRRAGSALRLIALTALAPALAIGLVYTLFDRFGILPGRAAPVLEAALWALAGYVFISGLVAAVLAPNRPEWRIAALGNRPARGFAQAARASAGLLAVGKLIEAVHGAIVAAPRPIFGGVGRSISPVSTPFGTIRITRFRCGLWRGRPSDVPRGAALDCRRGAARVRVIPRIMSPAPAAASSAWATGSSRPAPPVARTPRGPRGGGCRPRWSGG